MPHFDISNPSAGVLDATRSFLQRRHDLWIDGKWTKSASGATRPVFDPATGQQISTMSEGNAKDVDDAVKAARQAFESGPWRTMSSSGSMDD